MKRNEEVWTTRNISVVSVFFSIVFCRKTLPAAIKYVRTVLRDFFFLQFAVKFGFKKIVIVPVDHPLDKTVPFTPERVPVYLDFVAFWIRPLGYIRRRFGKKAGTKYALEFLPVLERCYREAARSYRFRMTTTDRPKYYRGKFLTIHLFDPHYLCVPSLHIIIVVLAYTFYRRAFAELCENGAEREALDRELTDGALAIAETVLYIKQHSVNCIPAALYTMTRITPEAVTPEEVSAFIARLFADAPDIDARDAERIRSHISDLYEKLFLEGMQDEDWITPIHRWLVNRERENETSYRR